uniref:Uncharacterized protein n=1 Tax=Setaria digitata TaxID=48799 RepID=A0A915PCC2_9BILA
MASVSNLTKLYRKTLLPMAAIINAAGIIMQGKGKADHLRLSFIFEFRSYQSIWHGDSRVPKTFPEEEQEQIWLALGTMAQVSNPVKLHRKTLFPMTAIMDAWLQCYSTTGIMQVQRVASASCLELITYHIATDANADQQRHC